ncbi:YopX family protein [Streptococcus ruminantium]|uniref:YopX family protein n=1 Tax=Streptococcus ruminantium TaxID=1917441 RepID=UPI0012DE71EE|nr:YopX family protein [Streptococcus ruminantium]
MVVPKFRAWYDESGIMYEVKSLIFTLKSMLCVNKNALYPERMLYFDDDNVKLMQFTGLFDKDGKEIFEGDIVKRTSLIPGGFDLIGIVKQLEGSWVIDTGKEAVDLWSEIDENEVLGNVYKNPELVEK